MRIAQVAPLYESVPPKLYGGTERVVSYLTEELVRRGHEVTLFASGDSKTSAALVSPREKALRLDSECNDPLIPHFIMLEQVFERASEFDVIHFHCDYLHFPLSRRCDIPNITTLHGRLDLSDLEPLYREFCEARVISISDAQRGPLPWLNWQCTVYHGLPLELYEFCPQVGDYLAFTGRVSPEKGLERAIEVAKQVGMKLRIAAKVDKSDARYFETIIKPLLDHPLIEFLGEIKEADKNEFLGRAQALMVPVDWPEPFGLVMIEAMACGTPVIAWRRGSIPEVVDEGHSGFIVDTIEQGVEAVRRIGELRRSRCREVFERRFSAGRMTDDYLAAYERLVESAMPAGERDDGRR